MTSCMTSLTHTSGVFAHNFTGAQQIGTEVLSMPNFEYLEFGFGKNRSITVVLGYFWTPGGGRVFRNFRSRRRLNRSRRRTAIILDFYQQWGYRKEAYYSMKGSSPRKFCENTCMPSFSGHFAIQLSIFNNIFTTSHF